MKIAVLGGSGFAGKAVIDELHLNGYRCKSFSRSTGCDLLETARAAAIVGEYAPDYIVNCAADVGSLNYVTQYAADVLDVNCRLVLSAFNVAKHCGAAVLINPIANCVYPGDLDVLDERRLWDGAPHISVMSYAVTRRLALAAATCYGRQYGARTVSLIVPNMYGPGDSIDPSRTHALNALVIKFVRATIRDLSSVEIWGTGRPVREWLYVKDFARLVRLTIESGDTSAQPVNLAQGAGQTIAEIVDIIRELCNYDGEVFYNTNYQDGAASKIMRTARFRERFPGFSFTQLERGIQDTIAYYRTVLDD